MISEAVDHDPNDPQSLAVQISSIYDSLWLMNNDED
jgi:hypothetical protein